MGAVIRVGPFDVSGVGDLRSEDAAFFQPPVQSYALASMQIATLSWQIEVAGRLAMALWIVPECFPGPRRGWVQMVFGRVVDEVPAASWAHKAFRYHRGIMKCRPFDVLRAWVAHDDARAQSFARRAGFEYDAGPCSELTYDGRDADLYIWRAT